MLRGLPKEVWAFDAEWVPDIESGRRVYALADTVTDAMVLRTMWERGGATEDDPHPYLKTMMCRVVSIAAVIRKQSEEGKVTLDLRSVPNGDAATATEADILARFLGGVGKAKPQLVGFNSRSADLMILAQRAMVNRLALPEFCRRSQKPWEGIDYFAKTNDSHVDLKEEFGGWGKTTPSLHEFATCCRIPGKSLADGQSVVDLWLAGDGRAIVQYNECDALTTYLLWLRAALLGGHVSPEQHEREEALLEEMLLRKGDQEGHEHLLEYVDQWQELRGAVGALA